MVSNIMSSLRIIRKSTPLLSWLTCGQSDTRERQRRRLHLTVELTRRLISFKHCRIIQVTKHAPTARAQRFVGRHLMSDIRAENKNTDPEQGKRERGRPFSPLRRRKPAARFPMAYGCALSMMFYVCGVSGQQQKPRETNQGT